jgi:hypothetical protein
MKIDEKRYILPEDNYIKAPTIKKQIIIGHTSTSKMRHFDKWTNRMNGNYKKTAPYTIDNNGNVFNHFEPIYFSEIFGNLELDKKSIVILLENEGWLVKDAEKNRFINWIGHIYNKPELVIERKWRGQTYWAPYSDKQVNATIQLVGNICDEFNIDRFAIPHNTKIDDFNTFNGVIYRSNINKNYIDLSPALSCENFKYK